MRHHSFPKLPCYASSQGSLDGRVTVYNCLDCHAVQVIYTMGTMITKVELVEPPRQSCKGAYPVRYIPSDNG